MTLIRSRSCRVCRQNSAEGFAEECRPCREEIANRAAARRGSRRRTSVEPLTRAESEAAARAIQSYIDPAKRADVEREWAVAQLWAESQQITFPWEPSCARDYAIHVVREYGVLVELAESGIGPALTSAPPKIFTAGSADKVNLSTFNGRMGPVDTIHVAMGYAPPWQRARVDFDGWWSRFKKLYLTRQRTNAKDGLELPDLLVILSRLAVPGLRELRDAALISLAADPRLELDTAAGGRPGWSFLSDIQTSNVVLNGDGSVVARAKHQRGFACVYVPPGPSASAVRNLVLWQQPQRVESGVLLFDDRGRPERDLAAWDECLFVRDDRRGRGESINPSSLQRAAMACTAGRAGADEAWTKRGTKLELTLPEATMSALIRDLHRPSLSAVRDGAQISNAFWLGARGMETTGRAWSHVEFVSTGAEWSLPRKSDTSGRRVKYAVPHLSLKFADPVRWLRLLREGLNVRIRALYGRDILPTDPIFPASVARPDTFATTPGEFSKRLKLLVAAAGIQADVATHSLRIGASNSLRQLGVPDDKIMMHLDWSDLNQYRSYFRDRELHSSTAAVAQAAARAGLAAPRDTPESDFMSRLRQIVTEARQQGEMCLCNACAGEQWTVAAILGADATRTSDFTS